MNYFIKHKKIFIFIILIVGVVIFSLLNTLEIDGKYYSRFCTDVDINCCTDKDAEKLKTMPFVTKLFIFNCQTNDISFVENMPFLSSLDSNIFNGDLSPIIKCTNLKSFGSESCVINDFTYFSELNKLEELWFGLFIPDVKIYSLKGIEKVTSLKIINLSGVKQKEPIDLKGLDELESLFIGYSDIVSLNIECEKINTVFLQKNPDLQKCTFSNKCDNLEEIRIHGCQYNY